MVQHPAPAAKEQPGNINKQREQQIAAVQQYQQHTGYETGGSAARNRIFGLLGVFTR